MKEMLKQLFFLRELECTFNDSTGAKTAYVYYLRFFFWTTRNKDWLDDIIANAVSTQLGGSVSIKTFSPFFKKGRDQRWNYICSLKRSNPFITLPKQVYVVLDADPSSVVTNINLPNMQFSLFSKETINWNSLQSPATSSHVFIKESEYNQNKIADKTIFPIDCMPHLV